ncbi:MAG: hypothetical protein ACFFDN_03470 [Candidatus Hodarchaeota archaeon]
MGRKLKLGIFFLIIIGLSCSLGIYLMYKSDQTRRTNLRIVLELFVPFTIKIESNTMWSGEILTYLDKKDISGGSSAKYIIFGFNCELKIEKVSSSGDVYIKIYGWGIKTTDYYLLDGTKEGRVTGTNPLMILILLI